MVTFDSQGGSAVETQVVAKGGKVVEPPAPTKECNCEFAGWYLGDEKWSFIGYTVTEDITLTAKYFECFDLNDSEREILEECVLSQDYTWHDVKDIQKYDTSDFSNQEAVEYTVIFRDGKTFTITIAKSYLK